MEFTLHNRIKYIHTHRMGSYHARIYKKQVPISLFIDVLKFVIQELVTLSRWATWTHIMIWRLMSTRPPLMYIVKFQATCANSHSYTLQWRTVICKNTNKKKWSNFGIQDQLNILVPNFEATEGQAPWTRWRQCFSHHY